MSNTSDTGIDDGNVRKIIIKADVDIFANYGTINQYIQTRDGTISHFINYGTIKGTSTWASLYSADTAGEKGTFKSITNYGTISNRIWLKDTNAPTHIVNYGVIENRGIYVDANGKTVILKNYNTIKITDANFKHLETQNGTFIIKDYLIKVQTSAKDFATFSNNSNDSHLQVSNINAIKFEDENSRLILKTGGNFEFNKEYPIDKLILQKGNNNDTTTHIDAFRLTTKDNWLEVFTNDNHTFTLKPNGAMSEVAITQKANIKSLNSLMIQSDEVIFGQKIDPKKQKRVKRTAKRTRQVVKNNDNFAFSFVPFVALNTLGKQNRYDLAGLEYGFISAFTQKIFNESFGLHLAFSLNQYNDTSKSANFEDFYIKNMNFMLGGHYKLDLPYLSYVKARLDGFYFMNEFDKIPYYWNLGKFKPNNLAAGASVFYGKGLNLGYLGLFSLEGGADYKAFKQLKTLKIVNELQEKDEEYEASLYHLLYAELALKYHKRFNNTLALNLKAGGRLNALKNAAKGKMLVFENKALYQSVDFTLDNDAFLGYANVGLTYAWANSLHLSLNYSGIFGDKTMSNAGNFTLLIRW